MRASPERWIVLAGGRWVVAAPLSAGRIIQAETRALTRGGAPWGEAVAATLAGMAAQPGPRAQVDVIAAGLPTLVKALAVPRVAAKQQAMVLAHEVAQALPHGARGWARATLEWADDGVDQSVLLAATAEDGPAALIAALQGSAWNPRRVLALPGVVAGALAQHGAAAMTVDVGAETLLILGRAQNGALQARGARVGFGGADEVDPAYVDRVVREVNRSYVAFRHAGLAQAPIFLTGEAGAVRGLAEAITDKLTDATVWGAGKNGIPAGMAPLLRAAAVAPPLDWTPQDVVNARVRRAQGPWWFAGAALVCLGGVLFAGLTGQRAQAWEARVAELRQAVQPLEQLDAEMRATLTELDAVAAQIDRLDGLVRSRANWFTFFADLQERLVTVEDVWLDALAVERRAETPEIVYELRLSGRMLDRDNPLARVSPQGQRRVSRLIDMFAQSEFVAAVGDKRFDHSQPGLLRFDFVLSINPERPL